MEGGREGSTEQLSRGDGRITTHTKNAGSLPKQRACPIRARFLHPVCHTAVTSGTQAHTAPGCPGKHLCTCRRLCGPKPRLSTQGAGAQPSRASSAATCSPERRNATRVPGYFKGVAALWEPALLCFRGCRRALMLLGLYPPLS